MGRSSAILGGMGVDGGRRQGGGRHFLRGDARRGTPFGEAISFAVKVRALNVTTDYQIT